MICHKCFTRIEGESRGRMVDDKLEFYHPDCAPEESKPIDPKVLESITKGVIKVLEILGCNDADRTEGVDYRIRTRGKW